MGKIKESLLTPLPWFLRERDVVWSGTSIEVGWKKFTEAPFCEPREFFSDDLGVFFFSGGDLCWQLEDDVYYVWKLGPKSHLFDLQQATQRFFDVCFEVKIYPFALEAPLRCAFVEAMEDELGTAGGALKRLSELEFLKWCAKGELPTSSQCEPRQDEEGKMPQLQFSFSERCDLMGDRR